MPTKTMLWQVVDNQPELIENSKLDFEERIENWIVEDASIVNEDLVVIGRQVGTDYGGYIDLLAIDPVGNLVILELKRQKTPRDIVAQALDYASWVDDLGASKVEAIAEDYLKGESLESAFGKKFQHSLPDVINERYRIYIVASEIDASTERIVKHLSEKYSVDINVATFSFFKKGNHEFLARSFLLDEQEVENRAGSFSKRKPPLTWDEMENLAEEHGVKEMYNLALEKLRPIFDHASCTRSNVSFKMLDDKKSQRGMMVIVLEATHEGSGQIGVTFYKNNFINFFEVSEETMEEAIGIPDPKLQWLGESIYPYDAERLDKLVVFLRGLKKK